MMKLFHHKMKAFLALAMALALAGCGGQSSGKKLRVGMECDYPPFNWTQTDSSGGAVQIDNISWAGGYDVEIAKRVAEGLGMELVIVKTEWDGLPPGVTSGKIDAIIAGMSNTAERRETLDFTQSYYTSDIVVVVRKDSPFASAKSIRDFSGAKITGQLNTLHYGFIDQMNGADKQNAMADFPTMTLAVSSGKIDGYVTERPGALSAVQSNPELTFVGFTGSDGFDVDEDEVSIAIAVAKNSPLRSDIDKILSGIDQDTRQSIMANAVATQPMNQD